MNLTILRIAVPSPLRILFDYLPPVGDQQIQPGQRLKIPFGRGEKIGIVVEVATESQFELSKLKQASLLLDQTPLWDTNLFKLIRWAANYYHHPLGDVFATALPVALKQGKSADYRPEKYWSLTDQGLTCDINTFKRAPKQAALHHLLRESGGAIATAIIRMEIDNYSTPLQRLVELGFVEQSPPPLKELSIKVSPHALNDEQSHAVSQITESLNRFQTHLLDGVTGSGKTEVYLQAMAPVLEAGRAVLVLVPEIGLTPQLVERFQERLSCSIGLLHSGLADGERLQTWLAAKMGDIQVLIGTRSSIFTPIEQLGMIIIDEEHDGSFKQQDGFRYSARDVAIKRAQLEKIPIVLGSGTPSIETLHHAQRVTTPTCNSPNVQVVPNHPQFICSISSSVR